jgi:hypothetical protein
MRKTIIFTLGCLLLPLIACKGKPEETFTATTSGDYKVIIRTQEFHHSGTVNVDVCFADANDASFPTKETQCFLHGYDFSDLTASWKSQTELVMNFRCGRVDSFRNNAFVYGDSPVPQEFYIYLNDACTLHDRTGDTKQ